MLGCRPRWTSSFRVFFQADGLYTDQPVDLVETRSRPPPPVLRGGGRTSRIPGGERKEEQARSSRGLPVSNTLANHTTERTCYNKSLLRRGIGDRDRPRNRNDRDPPAAVDADEIDNIRCERLPLEIEYHLRMRNGNRNVRAQVSGTVDNCRSSRPYDLKVGRSRAIELNIVIFTCGDRCPLRMQHG